MVKVKKGYDIREDLSLRYSFARSLINYPKLCDRELFNNLYHTNKVYLIEASYIFTALFIFFNKGIFSFSAFLRASSEVSTFSIIGL